jgi:hypothetical protein
MVFGGNDREEVEWSFGRCLGEENEEEQWKWELGLRRVGSGLTEWGEEKNRTLEAPRNGKLVVGKDGQVNELLY